MRRKFKVTIRFPEFTGRRKAPAATILSAHTLREAADRVAKKFGATWYAVNVGGDAREASREALFGLDGSDVEFEIERLD